MHFSEGKVFAQNNFLRMDLDSSVQQELDGSIITEDYEREVDQLAGDLVDEIMTEVSNSVAMRTADTLSSPLTSITSHKSILFDDDLSDDGKESFL